MRNIIDGLYVGGDDAYEKVKDNKEFSTLRCCKYGVGGHQQTLGYETLGAPPGPDYLWVKRKNRLALNMLDLDDPNFIPNEMILHGIAYIDEQMAKGQKVLVACNSGHSRGPTTALMWLRHVGEMPYSFGVSEKIYRTLYPLYSPGIGMRQKARMMWNKELENYGLDIRS